MRRIRLQIHLVANAPRTIKKKKRLLATPFRYADSSTGGTTTSLDWSNDWNRFEARSQQHWLDDVSPPFEQTLGTGFPESLDAEQWFVAQRIFPLLKKDGEKNNI